MATKIFFLFIASFAIIGSAMASDPDILTDFVVPATTNLSSTGIDSSFFTFTGLRSIIGTDPPPAFKVLKASMAEFSALNGQSVSYAVLEFPVAATNPPHTHPRASELLFLVQGMT